MENKDKLLTVRLTTKEMEAVELIAYEAGYSKSELGRVAVVQLLRKIVGDE